MPRRGRPRLFLVGLTKFLALVLVAGGVGVALGMGLTQVSADNEPAGGGSATGDGATSTAITTTTPPAPVPAAPAPTSSTTTPPITTAPSVAPKPLAQVRLSVLDARLFTDETPSGAREQRARVTMRIRAENAGTARVTLQRPILRVGSVRVPADSDARTPGSAFEPLAAGSKQIVTLRFSLAGEATPKVVRDRRVRVLVAGQSLATRVKVPVR